MPRTLSFCLAALLAPGSAALAESLKAERPPSLPSVPIGVPPISIGVPAVPALPPAAAGLASAQYVDPLEELAVRLAISLGVAPDKAQRLRLSPAPTASADPAAPIVAAAEVKPREVPGGPARQAFEDLRAWAEEASALKGRLAAAGLEMGPEHVYQLYSRDPAAPVAPTPLARPRFEALSQGLTAAGYPRAQLSWDHGWFWLRSGELPRPVGRFQLTAAGPAEALSLMKEVAAGLRRAGRRDFFLKTIDEPGSVAGRAGNVVLYVPRSQARGVYKDVLTKLPEPLLRAPVPLGARRLKPGVSYGDEPSSGASFGETRAQAVFEAVVGAARGAGATLERRLRAALARRGLDPFVPWLNRGALDPF